MKVEQIYTGCLAEAAYYIESKGEAVIIDPLRETKPYIEKLAENGVKLKYIFETHFHADFVSGHIDLAKETGATIVYGPGAKTAYDVHIAADGEIISLGDVRFTVLHTPGHTMESTTFLLKDETGKDYAVFTGDTLFIGDVGRPDLAQKAGSITKEDLAGMLYDSLRNKIMPLADHVLVYPAHGAGSACGKNMSKETFDTLGGQKQNNYALKADMSREDFIETVTAGLMPPPTYFAENAKLNRLGYGSIHDVLEKGVVPLSPEQLEEIVSRYDALILDTRHQDAFREGFIPGSVFIGIDGGFAPWVGALIPDLKQAIVLVGDENRIEEIVTRLARVGYDNTFGFLKGGIEAWKESGRETDSMDSMDAATFAKQYNAQSVDVLDVRKPTEYLAQHVDGVPNFPLDFINKNMEKLDRNKTYHLYCAGGYRSMITASILRARGFGKLIDIKGGWAAVKDSGAPVTNYVCPSTIDQEVIDQAIEESMA